MEKAPAPVPGTQAYNPYAAPPPQGYAPPPAGVPAYDPYLNDIRVQQLQNEIEANSCDAGDICLYLLFGPFALFCIMPKMNKKSKAKDELKVELSKPRRPM